MSDPNTDDLAQLDVEQLKEYQKNKKLFEPTPSMKLLAYAMFADPRTRKMSFNKILEEVGITEKGFKNWRKNFSPFFDDWLEEMRVLLKGNKDQKKNILEFVGMERALSGDPAFWKPLAIREGVISNDEVNVNLIPANLGKYSELSEAEIDRHRNSLLANLRSVEDEGVITLATGTTEGEQGSDSSGTPEMLEEPLALPESLGDDGERTLEDDIPL